MFKRLANLPVVGRILLFPFRFFRGIAYAKQPAWNFMRWLFASREYTNFTYDLEEQNKRYLAAFASQVSGVPRSEAEGYIAELESDQELRQSILQAIRSHRQGRFADHEIFYGKRLGWYAIARAMKPRVIVETGVDKGLGSCVLTAALKRNADEGGGGGYYYGTDINPEAGYLLQGVYSKYGEILYGDSLESLQALQQDINLFINDSDHSSSYEAREYETIEQQLTERAIIIGDNAHVSDELYAFAERTGRHFAFFSEKPRDHWYPGGGIGVAFET